VKHVSPASPQICKFCTKPCAAFAEIAEFSAHYQSIMLATKTTAAIAAAAANPKDSQNPSANLSRLFWKLETGNPSCLTTSD